VTALLITVDTELSISRHRQGMPFAENIARGVWGRTGAQARGIGWQMDVLDRHGLKGVYFVDPLPALVEGPAFLEDIVGAIVSRGHEVQLHVHTEWLDLAKDSPVGGRTGRNIGDFSLADQVTLLAMARDWLEAAGAPKINAFRAGNFGANDDTLRALAYLGFAWDSSVNADYLGRDCRVSLDPGQIAATRKEGVVELPVSGISDRPGHFRPAQICALSAREMIGGLRHAAGEGQPAFVVVTHSFEMLSRDRQRANLAVADRLERLCAFAAAHPGITGAGFHELDSTAVQVTGRQAYTRLPASRVRTTMRLVEQALATWRYERRLVPA